MNNNTASTFNTGLQFALNQFAGEIEGKRSWKYTQKAMDKQFDLNKRSADYTFAQNLKAWNLENEYNSPAAQMQRYMAAGLNPHLIYGQNNTAGSLSGGSFGGSSAPSVNTRSSQTFDIISGIHALQQVEQSKKQIELLESEIGLKKSQKGLVDTQASESLARTAFTKTRDSSSSFELALKRELRDTLLKTAINKSNLLNENVKLTKFRSQLTDTLSKMKGKEWLDYSTTGIRPNDSFWIRLVDRVAKHFFPSLSFETN